LPEGQAQELMQELSQGQAQKFSQELMQAQRLLMRKHFPANPK
jgi:hypothetical protein